jgi:hypothetical protein
MSTSRQDPGVQIPGFVVSVSHLVDTLLRDADPGDKSLTVQVQGASDVMIRVLTGNETAADAGTVGGTVGYALSKATAPSLCGGVYQTSRTGRVVARSLGVGACNVYVERER